MEARNYLQKEDPYNNSKTAKQWRKERRAVNSGASGKEYWCNGCRQDWAIYYLPEDTHPFTPEELEQWRAENREKARMQRERKKAEKLEQERQEQERIKYEKERIARRNEWFRQLRSIDRSKIVCLDVETTGLYPGEDEILQLSIIDGNNKVLFNEYIRPRVVTEWPDAEEINGISPDMVDGLPTMDAYIDQVNGILSGAELIVGYNSNHFDLSFIRWSGITVPDIQTYDVMLEFAEVYGQWSNYYRDYKWQKLTTCAAYYGYDGNGHYHDSLEDVRATLHCFYEMIKEIEDGN